jgi:hypothetical protein
MSLAVLAMACAAACVACGSGCITGRDGRWLGANSIGSLVDGGSQCNYCQHESPAEWEGACEGCDESPWSVNGPGDWQEKPLASPHSGRFAPVALDECGDGHCGSTCEGGPCRGLRRRWYEPEAGIFNFCIPPGVIGPPPPPPPGRFHPVPSRPVFAPRPSMALVLPGGEVYAPPSPYPAESSDSL